jgi:drug/metabolite transporter (DMT)-like permease|tara:strand:- start:210 stop:1067 length:858 start_codon:yes stop_codon:yes gene_type:complete
VTVLLAAASAVFFGVGDLLGGIAIRRSGRPGAAVSVAMTATAVAAVVVGLVLVVRPPEAVSVADVIWPVMAGLLMAATRPLLYLGMARGPVAVFAPGYGLTMIAVPALVGPFIGQHLTGIEVLGVLLAVIAVVLLSGEGRLPRIGDIVRSRVVGMAMAVGCSIGMAGVLLTQADPAAGEVPALLVLLTGLVVLSTFARVRSGSVWPDPIVRRFGLVLGFTSGTAFVLSTAAYLRGSAAVVTALIALCPGVSVGIAWRFLGERVAPLQVLGGVFGVASVVAFALGA